MEKLKKPAQFFLFLFLLVISSFSYWVQSTKDSTGVADTITAVDRSTGGRGGAASGGGGGGGHNGAGAGNTEGVNSDNSGSSSGSQSNFGATNSDQPRNNDDDRSHKSDAVRSISFLVHFIFAIVGLYVVLLSLLSIK